MKLRGKQVLVSAFFFASRILPSVTLLGVKRRTGEVVSLVKQGGEFNVFIIHSKGARNGVVCVCVKNLWLSTMSLFDGGSNRGGRRLLFLPLG